MSNKFDETVKAIAGCPVKVALFRSAPSYVVKSAGVGKAIVDTMRKMPPGAQDIVAGIAKGVGTSAIVGGGFLAFDAIREAISGKGQHQSEAEKATIGKLQAMGAVKKMTDLSLKPQQEKAFKESMRDPIIAKADKEMMVSAFETMKRFAPNLAADPNAAKSFLKEHAIYGTGPSYASLKTLVDTEAAIAKSGGSV